VDDETQGDEGIRSRLTKQGEDAIGKLAQDLLENPLISGAIGRAFEAREKAAQAQEVAMGALNLPSAADVERLTRRLRSVSQRLEGIEDSVDRVDERISTMGSNSAIEERLRGIEDQLKAISGELEGLRAVIPDETGPAGSVSLDQERLEVGKAD
jgi:CRP-like cAMP-binding protein